MFGFWFPALVSTLLLPGRTSIAQLVSIRWRQQKLTKDLMKDPFRLPGVGLHSYWSNKSPVVNFGMPSDQHTAVWTVHML